MKLKLGLFGRRAPDGSDAAMENEERLVEALLGEPDELDDPDELDEPEK
jgi:hypothetical protein